MTSPCSAFASATPSADLPVAVGPTMATTLAAGRSSGAGSLTRPCNQPASGDGAATHPPPQRKAEEHRAERGERRAEASGVGEGSGAARAAAARPRPRGRARATTGAGAATSTSRRDRRGREEEVERRRVVDLLHV